MFEVLKVRIVERVNLGRKLYSVTGLIHMDMAVIRMKKLINS
jgi:hypothetical protein